MSQRKLSVIISVYNEKDNLNQLVKVMEPILEQLSEKDWKYELLFVNDGSSDGSSELLNGFAKENKSFKVIHFSRNYGHEAAMLAGIDYAEGDLLVCMDADLQHPPALLPQIVESYEQGNDVILMARAANKDAGVIKNITSNIFYKVFNKISEVKFEKNVSDFFAISKRVAEVLRRDYRERTRYLRGYVQSLGYKKAVIEYTAAERFAGKSKYSIKNLFKIAAKTLNCFSITPLKAGVYSSTLSVILTLISFIYYIWFYVTNGYGSGTALLCCVVTFLFSILFVLLGIIGEYLGLLMIEVRNRPIYLVAETVNTDMRS